MKQTILIGLVLFVLIGCVTPMQRHRQYVKDGMLIAGLNREAFLKEWGMPDKTTTISSEEFSQFMAGAIGSVGSATYFKGKVPLDVWIYEQRGITLIFNSLRLVGWKTEKSRKELQSPQK